MAHTVTCQICGKKFDRDKIQAVYHSATRYSHQTCEPDNPKLVPMPTKKTKSQEDEDLESLKSYISELFGSYANWALIMRQIKDYHANQNMSYTGMQKTLKYFYDIQGNRVDKGNGGIGIIPYQYQNANKYYYSIWLAQQKNELITMEDMMPKERIIVIKSPERPIKKRRLFTFLDEEESDGE